ncbi:MAG: glycosyltransferase family 39 protein [Anaerolineae bacterium]|nr:glycosyltransferase family 39 protein [Anaerolineae bacterium]
MVSVLMGAVALVLTLCAANQAFPDQPWIRWGAVLTLLLWPQFRFATAIVNNDIMATAAGAGLTWALLRLATAPRPVDVLALGGAIGLALLSKNSTLALLPVTSLVLLRALLVASPATRRELILCTLGASLLGLAAVGWWYLRNLGAGVGMFGGAYSLRAVLQILTYGLADEGTSGLTRLQPTLQGALHSLWAAFGWANVSLPAFAYQVAAAGAMLALAGLPLWWLRHKQASQRVPAATVMLIVFSVTGTWMYFTITRRQVDLPGRYLLPVLPALTMLTSLGWHGLFPTRHRAIGWGVAASAMAALAIATPPLFILPAYTPPRPPTADELPSYVPTGLNFGGFVELIGYRLDSDIVDANGSLHVTLLWRTLSQTPRDYSLAVQVFEPERHILGEVQRFPGRGALATTTWQPGTVFAEEVTIDIQHRAPAPTSAWIEVSYFDRERLYLPIQVYSRHGQNVGASVRLGRIKVRGRTSRAVSPDEHSLQFGPAIRLTRVQIDALASDRNPRLDLDIYWMAVERPERDYTVSVQLRDMRDAVIAQVDEQPQRERYPTSMWEPAEVVRDRHRLSLTPRLAEGIYTLYLCMYDLNTLRRLPVSTQAGERYVHDEVALGRLVVTPGSDFELHPANPLAGVHMIPLGVERVR